jgi:predicted transglutaminase-like cysteine proteinase
MISATPLKDLVRKVNGRINSRIEYKTDMELYGIPEFWTIATSQGDCEDYALAKAIMLLDEGFPIERMRLATCTVEVGEDHAILIVTVEDGDWIMDNRNFYIVRLEDTGKPPYVLHRLQIPGTNEWEWAADAPELRDSLGSQS